MWHAAQSGLPQWTRHSTRPLDFLRAGFSRVQFRLASCGQPLVVVVGVIAECCYCSGRGKEREESSGEPKGNEKQMRTTRKQVVVVVMMLCLQLHAFISYSLDCCQHAPTTAIKRQMRARAPMRPPAAPERHNTRSSLLAIGDRKLCAPPPPPPLPAQHALDRIKKQKSCGVTLSGGGGSGKNELPTKQLYLRGARTRKCALVCLPSNIVRRKYEGLIVRRDIACPHVCCVRL